MNRRIRYLFPLVACVLLLGLPRVGVGQSPRGSVLEFPIVPNPKVEPELLKAALASDDPLRFIVHLREQVDLTSASRESPGISQRRSVVDALQSAAQHGQASLRVYLSELHADGRVDSYTPYWIFNGLAVVAGREILLELSQRPEVAIIRLDRRWQLSGIEEASEIRQQGSSGPEWNIERVRADLVWEALDINGEGVVVANVDTGVDWYHPALRGRYRGYDPKGFEQHKGNWFCATDEDYLYPGDGHGHGSHTMGLMVGRDEGAYIGVAPGARWIAVKAFDNDGYTYDSWIHSALEWLLAPEGDVTLAPQVVNNSWGSEVGSDTTFQADVQALRASGIIPIFSAGNDGPEPGTIGSPASFGDSLSVGATDDQDQIAGFSSRGPSPWGEVKPELVAPGVNIRSSVPGGTYASKDGTSAAAPHVAGVAALLLDARPSLGVSELEDLLTESARRLGEPLPNNDYGSGFLDAYAAVASAVDVATISGTVTESANGYALSGATVKCTDLGGQLGVEVVTTGQGRYDLVLASGTYTITASAFGYHPQIAPRLTLTRGQELIQDFILDPKPTGVLAGRVTQAATGSPISATVEVVGAPVQTQSNPQTGLYSLSLPAGTYTVSAKAPHHRVAVQEDIVVDVGQSTQRDFALVNAPTILVVDSGAWYFGSEIGYFTQALEDLNYLYDLWSIRQPFASTPDSPAVEDLAKYDVVIWSAPHDSPGYVGADEAIAGFLAEGGQLFLTGQDIGYWDGGGTLTYASYYREYLHARFVQDDSGVREVEGEDGLFSGLVFEIQGGDGAGNQLYPDEIELTTPDYAIPSLRYTPEGWAGQQAGICRPYKALYLAFGFEAINDRGDRREVMDRALAWLTSQPPDVAVELMVTSREPQVSAAGGRASHTLRLRNRGEGSEGSVFELSHGPSGWPVTLTLGAASGVRTELHSPVLELAPCASATLTVEVGIPPEIGQDTSHQLTITAKVAQGSLSRRESEYTLPTPQLSEMVTITTKTPAPVLLVDDDRWYDQSDRYQAALEGAGIAYDNWEMRWGSLPVDGSPSSPALEIYPISIWFTGYDWYETLTAVDEMQLGQYLSQGGRLLLSSQDYLFTRGLSSWGNEHLGVLTYTEDLSTTVALGVAGSAVSDGLGPYHLQYPFPNWSDALVPTSDAAPLYLGGHGYPIALGLSRVTDGAVYKTEFFAFPLEALSQDSMVEVMRQAVGWLSWLGESSLEVDKPLVTDGERLTYTALLQNDGSREVAVRFEGQIPEHTAYVPGTVSPGGVHEQELVIWEGHVAPLGSMTVSYAVDVDSELPAGTRVTNVGRVGYADNSLSFQRSAHSRVNAPDLSGSIIVADPSEVRSGETLTYHLSVGNEGLVDSPTTSLTVTIPSAVQLISSTVAIQGGGTASIQGSQLLWEGPIGVGSSVTITYGAAATRTMSDLLAVTSAEIDDGLGARLYRECVTAISPYSRLLLPIWRRWSPRLLIWQNQGEGVE